MERQQQKDMERDAQRKSVRYTLRVQDVLNGMDDEAKENFRSGANGAVVSCPTGTFLQRTYLPTLTLQKGCSIGYINFYLYIVFLRRVSAGCLPAAVDRGSADPFG